MPSATPNTAQPKTGSKTSAAVQIVARASQANNSLQKKEASRTCDFCASQNVEIYAPMGTSCPRCFKVI